MNEIRRTDLRNNTTWDQRLVDHLTRYWFAWFAVIYGVYVTLPFLAPVFLHIGALLPARIIYTVYSFLCHQLPERSFFLFGPKTMYSLAEIQSRWQQTTNPMILRQYIGDPSTGWKVAWSDRMVTLYTSIFFFGLLWWPLRKKIRPLPLFGLMLMMLPMALDGTSHLISDLPGVEQGFRSTNAWLVTLTGNTLAGWFYAGDALGSFNSWMRLISGTLFGLGAVWFLFPILERGAAADRLLKQARQDLRERLIQGSASGVSSDTGSAKYSSQVVPPKDQ
jgi:uncharacterized membrane protein